MFVDVEAVVCDVDRAASDGVDGILNNAIGDRLRCVCQDCVGTRLRRSVSRDRLIRFDNSIVDAPHAYSEKGVNAPLPGSPRTVDAERTGVGLHRRREADQEAATGRAVVVSETTKAERQAASSSRVRMRLRLTATTLGHCTDAGDLQGAAVTLGAPCPTPEWLDRAERGGVLELWLRTFTRKGVSRFLTPLWQPEAAKCAADRIPEVLA